MEHLEHVLPHYRALYEAGTKGTIAMDALELKYLRNFLILYAIYCIEDDHSGEISMLSKVSPLAARVLLSLRELKDGAFNTGVPKLNEWVMEWDFKHLCNELSLTLEYEEEEPRK